jgi:hypothetical protein
MEKDARLLLVHVKDLTDEEIEELIDRLYDQKVFFAEVINAGYRRRSGAVLMIEVAGGDEWRVASLLAGSYGISSYHLLDTIHRYQPVNTGSRPIVAVHNDKQVGDTVRFKLIGVEKAPAYVRVEDEDLARLKQRIDESFGFDVPAKIIRERLETLLKDINGFVLELHDLK